MISRVCAGFFEDPRHLERQFAFQTDSNISEKIRKNFDGHMGRISLETMFDLFNYLKPTENLEEYLLSMNTSLEYSDTIEKITEDCTLEFSGSKIHRHIHVLVE